MIVIQSQNKSGYPEIEITKLLLLKGKIVVVIMIITFILLYLFVQN